MLGPQKQRSTYRFLPIPLFAMAWFVVIAPDAPGQDTSILDMRTIWACHTTFRSVRLGTREQPSTKSEQGLERIPDSPLPPENWVQVGFDDSDWFRGRGPFFDGEQGYGFREPRTLALLCLRASFGVADPDKLGDLNLSVSYRGGIVVYLNGREIARSHMPEGPIDFETLADDYPKEAYVAPSGKRIGPPREWRGVDLHERCRLRIRETGMITLPRTLLRQGRNILAIAIHRTATATGFPDYAGRRDRWGSVALLDLKLSTEQPGGVTPNVRRPPGIQVWNANPLLEISDSVDYGDPFASLVPIRLVGTRNGVCSAQVIVSAQKCLQKLRASISPLKNEKSGSVFPPGAVQIRYARRTSVAEEGNPDQAPYFDILDDSSNSSTTLQPVWITATIPADSVAGLYKGTLRIELVNADPTRVPVELEICDWRLPDPHSFCTHVSLLQSPQAVAMRYGVPLWSERHFALLEKSFDLLGKAGNKVIYLPLIRHSHFGDEETIVRWIDRGDGQYEHDFRSLERYLDLYERHAGPPSVLCLYLWEPKMNSRNQPMPETVSVSRLVPANGEVSALDAPMYSKPGSKSFWKPVLDGIHARVKERGWSEEIIMLGVPADSRPREPVVQFFREISPYARWSVFSHSRGDPRPEDGKLNYDGMEVGYLENPGRPRTRYPLRETILYGWNEPFLHASSMRQWILQYASPASFRNLAEGSVGEDWRGFCRVGLDAWEVPVDGGEIRGSPIGRYHPWINLMRNNPRSIVAPGPDGAVSTVRFEMLREGIQECEARIFLEKALSDEKRRARLGESLADRCLRVLEERIHARLIGLESWQWYVGSAWQDRTAKLYATAAEVERALKSE